MIDWDPNDLDEAARALLDARTRSLASVPRAAADTTALEVVRLRVGGEHYALPTAAVTSVAALTRLTPVPHAPPEVAGLTALAGTVLPVFHLRAALGLGLTALPEYGRLVLLGPHDAPLALIVDAVEGTAALAPARLREPPPTLPPAARPLVRGVDPDGVALLDAEALLADPRFVVDVQPRPAREPARGA